MCTAIVTQTAQGDIYFGRTMDFPILLNLNCMWFPKAISGITS